MKQDKVIVYEVPEDYASVIGTKLIKASNKLLSKLRKVTDEDAKNEMIRAFVCKVEIIKEANGLRHKHTGYNSGKSNIYYILQYIQDLAILQWKQVTK